MTETTEVPVVSVEVGDVVVFVDPVAVEHNAIVTSVFGGPGMAPSVNVVFTSTDIEKTDTYGRQIERNTSVPHQSVQPAHGMYWR